MNDTLNNSTNNSTSNSNSTNNITNNHKQLTSPCHHCTYRKPLCHSTCLLYQEFSQSRTQANTERFKATEISDYQSKTILRERKRKNYKNRY